MDNKRQTTIYFIRHGEIDNPNGIIYGRNIDLPMTKEGFLQIKTLAEKLKKSSVTPNIIFTSPMTRTIQSTGELLKVFPNTPVIKNENLTDTDQSSLAGKTRESICLPIGADEYNLPQFKDKVEKPENMAKRIIGVVKKALENYKEKIIFIVSHGDPLAFTIWRLLHPKGKLPSVTELQKTGYLQKGEAWKVVFDENQKVIENEIITRSHLSGH